MIGKLRTLGVAFVAVFAMSAMAASAAHAEETHFTAGDGTGTAKVTIEADPTAPSQTFSTPFGTLACEEFHATGMGAATTTEITLQGVECGECELKGTGIEAFVEFHTCDYTIHGSGEVNIGPAGCGVTIEALTCKITVPGGQSFGAGTLEYTNVTTSGKPMEITAHANAAGIHGTATAACPGGGGTFTTGTYVGTPTARAFTTGGTQIDLTA